MTRSAGHKVLTAALLLCALGVAGCSSVTRFENAPLAPGAANVERRSIAPPSPERPAVLMAFSGGGTRAAALAAAVLGDMATTTYALHGEKHALTEDITLISSVSGGSVTAAWFGLHRGPGHWDGDLKQLRADFLAGRNMRRLGRDYLRMTFERWSRTDALEQLFTEYLYGDAHLGDLNRPGKPLVILNTTDMAGGEIFPFTPRQFDDICSDYDAVPVASAVAASAAVPVVLTPVAFRNYSAGCQGTLSSPDWFLRALKNPATALENLPEYREARYANDLRREPGADQDIDYLYFLDGGLADNLGVHSLQSALIRQYDGAGGAEALREGRIRRLVVVIVNARSDPPNQKIYSRPRRPGITEMVNSVISVPIASNTESSKMAFDAILGQISGRKTARGLSVYGVTIDFDRIPEDTDEHRRLSRIVNTIPTSWTLNPEQLAVIEEAGPFLLHRDPCYRALLRDLKAEGGAGGDNNAAGAACETGVDVDFQGRVSRMSARHGKAASGSP
jgi:NTE family protein